MMKLLKVRLNSMTTRNFKAFSNLLILKVELFGQKVALVLKFASKRSRRPFNLLSQIATFISYSSLMEKIRSVKLLRQLCTNSMP